LEQVGRLEDNASLSRGYQALFLLQQSEVSLNALHELGLTPCRGVLLRATVVRKGG
jgi:hypothetical protein